MKKYSLTLYTYDPGMKIKETTLKEKPDDPERSNAKAVGEDMIIKELSVYGFLNTDLIRRCLKMKYRSRVDVSKSLEKMQLKGKIKRYTIHLEGAEKQDIDIYILSKPIRDALRKSGKRIPRYHYDMDNIPYLLSQMSTAQWHIAVKEAKHIYESAYCLRVALKDGRQAVIPSLTAHTTIRGRKMYICALPLPKGGTREALAKFLKDVFIIDNYFQENRNVYRSCIYVLISEDDRQAEEACRYLSSVRETAGMYFLYTNDEATSSEMHSPLTLLYDLTAKGSTVRRTVISIG